MSKEKQTEIQKMIAVIDAKLDNKGDWDYRYDDVRAAAELMAQMFLEKAREMLWEAEGDNLVVSIEDLEKLFK